MAIRVTPIKSPLRAAGVSEKVSILLLRSHDSYYSVLNVARGFYDKCRYCSKKPATNDVKQDTFYGQPNQKFQKERSLD